MKRNYLVVELGDNDFSSLISRAVVEAITEHGYDDHTPENQWRLFIISYVTLMDAIRHNTSINWDACKHAEEYLSKLTVYYSNKIPEKDHDHGSYCYDLHDDYGWSF
jgi:hypothetical protein